MALTNLAVKNAKPKDKPYKLADERGLYLLVTPAGGRLWRYKYRFEGKERLLALGAFPDVSLAAARDAREEARRSLRKGVNPAAEKRSARGAQRRSVADSFESVAREWLAQRQAQVAPAGAGRTRVRWSPQYFQAVSNRLETNVFPKIGARPIAELEAADVLEVIRKIESRGAAEQARRAYTHISSVMRYAVITGRAKRDVAADVGDALAPVARRHHPAITEPKAVGKLVSDIERYHGTPFVKYALALLAHTFVRPSELRQAKWSEIDLDGRLWSIPAERTKLRRPHLVPLTDRTVAFFKALRELKGKGEWVLPGYRVASDKPISASSLSKALGIMGYANEEMVAHGFRAMASTRLHEEGFEIDVIEVQLAHALPGVRGIYNRALYLKERKEMMVRWSDYLDRLAAAHKAESSGRSEAAAV